MLKTLFLNNYICRAEADDMGGGGGSSSPADNANPAGDNPPADNGTPSGESTPGEGGTPADNANPAGDNQQDNKTEEDQKRAAAADLRKTFRVDFSDTGDSKPADNADPSKSGETYTVTMPKAFIEDARFGQTAADNLSSLLADLGQKSGMSGDTFGELVANAYTRIQDAQDAALDEACAKDAESLKGDWGSAYESNIKIAKDELRRWHGIPGMPEKALDVMMSPVGMRVLYAVAKSRGERPAAGTGSLSASEKDWARSVMHDPKHPDYDAFRNPDNPRFAAVNERWKRAQGV